MAPGCLACLSPPQSQPYSRSPVKTCSDQQDWSCSASKAQAQGGGQLSPFPIPRVPASSTPSPRGTLPLQKHPREILQSCHPHLLGVMPASPVNKALSLGRGSVGSAVRTFECTLEIAQSQAVLFLDPVSYPQISGLHKPYAGSPDLYPRVRKSPVYTGQDKAR